jgi:killing trait domain-containing protein
MAETTLVNGQITDAVTQTNVKVLGEAPAQSMALVYQTMAHSISLAMENAQQAQGGLQQIGNAVTSSAITMIMNAARQFEGKPTKT